MTENKNAAPLVRVGEDGSLTMTERMAEVFGRTCKAEGVSISRAKCNSSLSLSFLSLPFFPLSFPWET